MDRPKLRKLEKHRLDREGETLIVLRDPQGVSEPVALPEAAAPLLELLDGERSAAQIRQTLLFRGVTIDREEVEGLLLDLSDAGLLDDDNFRERWSEMHEGFTASARRPARFAGLLYPEAPAELKDLLATLLGPPERRRRAGSDLAGLIIPHQPFERCAELLSETLRDLPEAADIDCVVILGTDHHPGLTPYTTTDKTFETPLGPVFADTQRVRALGRSLDWIRREEIRHREAMSVELASVLLRYLYGDATPPILPILCGHSALLVGDASAAADDFQALCGALSENPRVLWVAVAEFGHCGAAYGRPPIQEDTVELLAERDGGILEALIRGQIHDLQRRCLADEPTLGPPSGAAVLTTLSRLLPVGYHGRIAAYEVFRAPGAEVGLIGLGGVELRRARS